MDHQPGNVESVAERLPALLSAVLSVGSDLELEAVLRRIVETAVDLVDCEYGAIGVIGEEYAGGAGLGAPGKVLVEFITTGLTAEEQREIGALPHGEGILGLLVREPRMLRLEDLTRHPASVGFPANHPPMNSFLGVPIRIRGEVFGNLYLTQKRGGSFTAADESVVLTLATAAGVAIDNARLYGEARRSEEWQRAMTSINQTLLVGEDSSDALYLVAASARQLVDADISAIGFADADGRLVIEVADGTGAAELVGSPLLFPEPSLLVPLGWRSQSAALCVANNTGGARFGPSVVTQLQSFAGQAVLALELAEARRDTERLVLFEDRDRIARDLHDTVIQQLFAAGLHLQSISRQVSSEIEARIHDVVDDLDATILQIRSTIYSLQTLQRGEDVGARARIAGLVDQLSSILGFRPSVHVDGLVDSVVSDELADDLVAVTRETLSNVARHASATSVELSLHVTSEKLVLCVCDNGKGFVVDGDGGRRSGLANLADRALARGGTAQVTSDPNAEGAWTTVVTWSVPVD